MNLAFEYVNPKNLRPVWSFVRQGLERIAEKSPVSWIPEDVYTTIRIGRSFLYIAKEPARVVGFFIVEKIDEPFTYEPILQVVCIYAPGEGSNFADVLDYEPQLNAELDRLAKAINAKRVRWTGRAGWSRAANCRKLATIYERVIE